MDGSSGRRQLPDEHLDGHDHEQHREGHVRHPLVHPDGQLRGGERGDHARDPDGGGDAQVGVPVAQVACRPDDRGREDHGQRRPLGDRRREAEEHDHRGDEDDAATDTQQPGEDPRDDADPDQHQDQPERERRATAGFAVVRDEPDSRDDHDRTANPSTSDRVFTTCRRWVPTKAPMAADPTARKKATAQSTLPSRA